MRLVSADSQRLIFRGRRPARSAALVGVAFIGVAIGPLLHGSPANTLRFVTSSVAAIVAALCIRAGWPRRRVAILDRGRQRLEAGGESYPLCALRALRLESGLDEDDLPQFRVDVEFAGGRHTLLSNAKPEAVLRDLAVLAPSVDLPIVLGWGLPTGARPWRAPSKDVPSPVDSTQRKTLDISLPEVAAQREIGWTVVIGGVVVATIAVFQVGIRLAHGDAPMVMDILLPLLLVTFIVSLGIAVLTRVVRIRMNGSLSIEWRVFGLVRKRRAVPARSLRAVYAIGPEAQPATHVLIETDRGPLAIPSSQRPAVEIAATIERHL